MTGIGVALGILAVAYLFLLSGGNHQYIGYFIDVPSMLVLVLICAACVFTSKATGLQETMSVIQKAVVPAGVFITLFSLIMIAHRLDDVTTLGLSLAVAFLPLMYALIVYIVLIPVNVHLCNKK
jgi:hypothetical protein